jgi:hypothetical protein
LRDFEGKAYQFSIIQGHNHTQTPHTQTSDESTAKDKADSVGVCLNNDTDTKDNDCKNSCLTTTDRIREPSIQQGADPGSKLENGSCDGLFSARFGGVTFDLSGLISNATCGSNQCSGACRIYLPPSGKTAWSKLTRTFLDCLFSSQSQQSRSFDTNSKE